MRPKEKSLISYSKLQQKVYKWLDSNVDGSNYEFDLLCQLSS